MAMETGLALPVFLLFASVLVLAMILLGIAALFNPNRPGPVKQMPYESGMDPIHDTRRRFDVRFYLLAIAFLVFDVELLFLYPWAVAMRPAPAATADAAPTATATAQGTAAVNSSSAAKHGQARGTHQAQGITAAVNSGLASSRDLVFAGAMLFIVLLALGFAYDWRKGVFQWR
jgi:NADH-quinone oxidoreductase subunit A